MFHVFVPKEKFDDVVFLKPYVTFNDHYQALLEIVDLQKKVVSKINNEFVSCNVKEFVSQEVKRLLVKMIMNLLVKTLKNSLQGQ